MVDLRIASRYVKSLLSLAIEQGAVDAVHADMRMFDEVCDSHREFLVMMRSPIVKHDLKRDILEKLFKDKVHPLTWAILDIITRKNREALLPAIANDFHRAYNEYMEIGFSSVTTATPMDDSLRREMTAIAQKLSRRQKVELVEKVDASLIGGFVLNVGDQQVDASVASRLRSLRHSFSYNPYQKEI